MPRIFIHHDQEGRILSVASMTAMPADLPHPYYLEDPLHAVLEAPADHPALAKGVQHIHENMRVDVSAGRLVPLETKPPSAQSSRRGRKET